MRLLVLFLALLQAAPSILGAPWPEFRGRGRTGVAADGSFPTHFGPSTHVRWSTQVPRGHSSPVIWGDHLFLTAYDEGQLLVLAFDRRNGRERWRRGLPPGRIEPGSRLSHPATATPVTDGQRLIAYFAPFGLVAYDLDGTELWRHPLPTPVTQHGASSSPTLAGDRVLQLCDQDADSFLLALDTSSGQIQWRAERPTSRRGFSTPLPWPTENPRQLLVAGTLSLTAYQLADGSESWVVHGLPNEMVSSPVADSERVIVAGWTPSYGVESSPDWNSLLAGADADQDGRLTRAEAPPGPARQHFAYMDANEDGRLDQTEYDSIVRIFRESRNSVLAIRPGGRGDVTQTHVLWRQNRGLPYVPTPLLYDGRLYLVKNGGLVSCLNPNTGEYLYREERMGALGDNYSSPVAAGGQILIISQPGTAVVLRAGDTLDVLARNPLGEEVLATPAIVEDTLFVRTLTRLFAFSAPPVP